MYVTPRWKGRSIHEISRSDVNALLDDVADGKISGTDGKLYGTPAMADQVLAQLRACFSWYQVQDDKFISPIVKGMRKTNPRRTARDRVLSDSEIRALWRVLPNHGLYGKLVQTLLLTAQRRDEVASMTRSEIDADGIWTIPAERYKTGRANVVPLPKHVQTILEDIDQIDECDFYFTTNGKTSFSGFSKAKALLDEAVLAEMKKAAQKRGDDPKNVTLPYWRLHDLRRTARTLMARAGVRPDICERVLGHVIAGVEGVYDRHDYIEQKQNALTSLAAMIDKITDPPPANVVAIRGVQDALPAARSRRSPSPTKAKSH